VHFNHAVAGRPLRYWCCWGFYARFCLCGQLVIRGFSCLGNEVRLDRNTLLPDIKYFHAIFFFSGGQPFRKNFVFGGLILICGQRTVLLCDQLNDVIAKTALNRFGGEVAGFFQSKSGGFKFRHHGARAKPAEVAAIHG